MNLYFWIFSLYALLITPVSAGVSVRIGHGLRLRIRITMAGVPFRKKIGEEDMQETRPVDSQKAMKGLLSLDAPVWVGLIRRGALQQAVRTLRLESIWVRARISFEDAAVTAMTFAAIRTVLQLLSAMKSRPFPLAGRLEADFHGTGTEVFFRCIVGARLGSLAIAAIRLIAAVISIRSKRTLAEEETYAASH